MHATSSQQALRLILAICCMLSQTQARWLGEQDDVANETFLLERASPNRNPPRLRNPIADILPKLGSDGAEESYRESLGSYQDNLRPLNENFDNPEERFYHAKVADYLYYENPEKYPDEEVEYARTAEGGASEYGEPFGRLTATRSTRSADADTVYTTVFDPGSAADVCKAWTTLAAYCGGDDTRCVCSSGPYYVPDQWNSLAAGCAQLGAADCRDLGPDSCSLADTAASYTDWCRPGPDDVPFALAPTVRVEITSSTPEPSGGFSTAASVGQNLSVSMASRSASTASSCTFLYDSSTLVGACEATTPPTTSAQPVGYTASATPSASSTVSGQTRAYVNLSGVAVVLLALTHVLYA